MFSVIKWDWMFFGGTLIFALSALVAQSPSFLIAAVYAFCLAIRLGHHIEWRTGLPIMLLFFLLYGVQVAPHQNYTATMIFTIQALILFRGLLVELRQPSLVWVIPFVIEFGINVALVYASIKGPESFTGIHLLARIPGRLLGVAVGVELWLKLKDSLKTKK